MKSSLSSAVSKIKRSWNRWALLACGLAVGNKVQIRINKPDWGCVMSGVLQVSALIPLLFIIKDFFHDFNFLLF